MVYSSLPAPDARSSDRLGVGIKAEPEKLQVQVVGELDLATAPQLASCLRSLSADTGSLCLDLTRVTFLDLSGLRVLLDARRDAHARGAHLRIVAPSGACRRLFELTETEYLLNP
jgi:anti-sigma B factor antagonist